MSYRIPAFLNDREIGSLDPDSHFVALWNGEIRLTEIGPASSADAPSRRLTGADPVTWSAKCPSIRAC
jgi:hypothetical protein